MKRKLLYYPYIDIPNLSFVKKVILYWDEISSIVPSKYEYKYDLNPHIKYLEDEGEYEPVFTDNLYFHCKWADLENVKENFKKEVIETLNFLITRRRKSGKITRLHREKIRGYKIHKNKIIGYEDEIYEFLKDKFLITEESEWMYLPEDIADIIMSILAKYLAICDEDYTIPATDKKKYEEIGFKIKKVRKDISNQAIALNFFLKKLPTPKDDVSLQDIIQFKRERYDELIEFRNFMLNFVNKFQEAQTIEEIKEVLINFEETFNKKKREIEKMLKDSRIDFKFTTVKTLIPLSISRSVIDNFLAYIKPIFVRIGVNFMETFIKAKKQIEKNELAYLYYAEKEGILNF